MSRKPRHSDSLDLLLDTICNTFGGIVFIAMLVMIMLQTSGNRAESRVADTAGALLEVDVLQEQLESVLNEIERAQQVLQTQSDTISNLIPQEFHGLLERRQDLLHERQLAVSEQADLAREIEDLRESHKNLLSSVQKTERELEQAQNRSAVLREQLEQTTAAKHVELSTPLTRSSPFKSQVGLVLQYNRLYLWHRYTSSGSREGLNTEDFVVLDSSSTWISTTPHPLRGIPLSNHPAAANQIRQLLKPFSPRTTYLVFVVRPDSFGTFHVVRDVIRELGFEYNLMPTSEMDTPIRDRGGSGGRVQ